MKKYLLIFILSFLFSFVFFYMIGTVYCDEVWLYGFSHNLSRGMVIYRDYNVVVTPFYFFIVSIFIRIFGEYIMVMHMVDSIMYASIIVILYKLIGKKVFIMLPLFMFFGVAGYNLMCLFFFVIIIYLLNKGYDNDILIAFLVGLCFITKQNIGVFLFIPCFIYSKNKLKSVCSFMIPLLVVVIYLVYKDSLYQFIDYFFLGLFDFGCKNLYLDKLFVILFIINVIYILYKLCKSSFKDKGLLYILSFQLIMYPIFDIRHYLCSLFLVLYVILEDIHNKQFLLLISSFVYFLYIGLFFSLDYDINFKSKNIDYLKNNGELEMLANSVSDYIGDNNNFFFIDFYGYYIKLYYDIPISRYDLLLSGNVGFNGMNERLEELDKLCNSEVCYFFIDNSKNYEKKGTVEVQYSEFLSYIKNNYQIVDSLYEFDIYSDG